MIGAGGSQDPARGRQSFTNNPQFRKVEVATGIQHKKQEELMRVRTSSAEQRELTRGEETRFIAKIRDTSVDEGRVEDGQGDQSPVAAL
jgi:hypothetical protein